MIKYAITRDTRIPDSHHIKVIGDSLLGRIFAKTSNLAKVQALAETLNHYVTLIENS